MMTSWNETQQIEAHLLGHLDNGCALVVEARMIIDPKLHDKVVWQQKSYELIQRYGRRQLKQEIENIHQQLFSQPKHKSFSQKKKLLFTNR